MGSRWVVGPEDRLQGWQERGGLGRGREGKSRGIQMGGGEKGGFECQTGKEGALGVLGQVPEVNPEILRQGVS